MEYSCACKKSTGTNYRDDIQFGFEVSHILCCWYVVIYYVVLFDITDNETNSLTYNNQTQSYFKALNIIVIVNGAWLIHFFCLRDNSVYLH